MPHPNIYHTAPETEFYTPEQCHIIEIFNRLSNPELSIARARVEPGASTVNHRLRNTAEWYYILQGRGEMFLNGAPAGHVSPGMVVHIPANTPQYIRNTGPEDLVFLCICTPGFAEGVYAEVK